MCSEFADDFGSLKVGQKFRVKDSVYCKRDERTAVLLDAATADVESTTNVHTFYPEIKVEVVEDDDG